MDGWILNLLIVSTGIIAAFVIVRHKTNESTTKNKEQDIRLAEAEKFINQHKPLLAHLSKVEEVMFKKLDENGTDITALKQNNSQKPSMEAVRAEFVSKEMFKQMEKHIDEKFDKLENGIEKILAKLEK